jgi:hypothetical protein
MSPDPSRLQAIKKISETIQDIRTAMPAPVTLSSALRSADITTRAVSQLLRSLKGREEWFSSGGNHERRGGFGLHQLRNRCGRPCLSAGENSKTS